MYQGICTKAREAYDALSGKSLEAYVNLCSREEGAVSGKFAVRTGIAVAVAYAVYSVSSGNMKEKVFAGGIAGVLAAIFAKKLIS